MEVSGQFHFLAALNPKQKYQEIYPVLIGYESGWTRDKICAFLGRA